MVGYTIYYPKSLEEKNSAISVFENAEKIIEFRPSTPEDFTPSRLFTNESWYLCFSYKWSAHMELFLNRNSSIVTSKGEIYEFQDFPKLAMMLERAKLEETLEAL